MAGRPFREGARVATYLYPPVLLQHANAVRTDHARALKRKFNNRARVAQRGQSLTRRPASSQTTKTKKKKKKLKLKLDVRFPTKDGFRVGARVLG